MLSADGDMNMVPAPAVGYLLNSIMWPYSLLSIPRCKVTKFNQYLPAVTDISSSRDVLWLGLPHGHIIRVSQKCCSPQHVVPSRTPELTWLTITKLCEDPWLQTHTRSMIFRTSDCRGLYIAVWDCLINPGINYMTTWRVDHTDRLLRCCIVNLNADLLAGKKASHW